jgi:hypothetical protein
MTAQSYLSHAIAKPTVAGLAAAAADHFIMKNTDIKSNMDFAGAVGADIFSVSWLEPLVSHADWKSFEGVRGQSYRDRLRIRCSICYESLHPEERIYIPRSYV